MNSDLTPHQQQGHTETGPRFKYQPKDRGSGRRRGVWGRLKYSSLVYISAFTFRKVNSLLITEYIRYPLSLIKTSRRLVLKQPSTKT